MNEKRRRPKAGAACAQLQLMGLLERVMRFELTTLTLAT